MSSFLQVIATYLTKEGEEEPEHPAPVLALAPEGDGDHHGTAAAANTASTEDSHDETTEAADVSGTDNTARMLGGAGLVVGALGVGFGVG